LLLSFWGFTANTDYHGLPARAGHLKSIEKFDSKFFKLNKLHVEGIDPQIRLLMEVTYEAIADSGLSMAELKGSRTGVYIGHCFSDYHNGIIKNINTVNGYENVGSANSMAANKLSYFFGFHGPSFTIDTACSSSLVALDRACCDLESGIIDRAIVGGLSLNLRPTISRVFQKYNMMSPTGTCYRYVMGVFLTCLLLIILSAFLTPSYFLCFLPLVMALLACP
jgi:fatty acid synthase